MTTKNNIPVGYKDSAVGIIPQEWEVKTLCECFSISAGRDLQKAFYSATPSEIHRYPIFSNSLENKGLYGYTSHPRHKSGSITITGRGMLGVAEYRNIDFDAIVRLLVLFPKRPITGSLIAEYINFKKPFYLESTGVPQLTAPQIANTPIPIPPLTEQRKIAEILGVWDEAIEKQSRLIEKLELRKRALMQRLLTGRTRLPGFTTPWQKVKLGEIGTFLSTNTLSRDKLNDNNGSIQNIHYGDILVKYSSIVDAKLTAIPYVNEDVAISSDYLENGDIVFSDTAEDNIVGKAVEISNIADKKIVAGLHTMLFRPNKGSYAQHFLGYYLNSDAYRKQLAPLIQGIKVCSISKRAICHTIVLTPSLPEQKAIAEVLTTADDEIATHRKKLDALRLQKRGLMQQLLTGKTRVKI